MFGPSMMESSETGLHVIFICSMASRMRCLRMKESCAFCFRVSTSSWRVFLICCVRSSAAWTCETFEI